MVLAERKTNMVWMDNGLHCTNSYDDTKTETRQYLIMSQTSSLTCGLACLTIVLKALNLNNNVFDTKFAFASE